MEMKEWKEGIERKNKKKMRQTQHTQTLEYTH